MSSPIAIEEQHQFGIWRLLWLGCFLTLLPIVAFYALLWSQAVNLPYYDDYHAVLYFLNGVHYQHGVDKLLFVLSFQHTDYKLIFESSIFALEYQLLGHVNFLSFIALGDAFVLLIFLVLYRMFRPGPGSPARKLCMLAPAAFLLFQLQYVSTLNWAMGGLQNLPVIFFAFAALYLLDDARTSAFATALLSLLLAIASSGNGFLVAIPGVLLLLQQRQWRRLPVWFMATLAMVGLYAYRYQLPPDQHHPGGSAASLFEHFNVAYALGFLGSSAATYTSYLPGLMLGLALCVLFAVMVHRRYHQRNPPVFYACVFILLTAIAVSVLRSEKGVGQSVASRYRIYSNLLLILGYLYIVEDWLRGVRLRARRRTFFAVAVCGSALFCAISDVAGYRFLQLKTREMVRILGAWENPGNSAFTKQPVEKNPVLERSIEHGLYIPNFPVLEESIRLGIYAPPRYTTPPRVD